MHSTQQSTSRKIKKSLAKIIWLISGYKHVKPAKPFTGARIFIGAPHTSNWDFLLMLAVAWDLDIKMNWLGKKEMFPKFAARFLKKLGGIPVDRKNPGGLVRQIIKMANANPDFMLVITPEGTRTGNGWKSGFYRIARAAKLPVTLGFIDKPSRTAGLGITVELTGNVQADMDKIREFYKDKSGFRPQHRTEPRLREELAR